MHTAQTNNNNAFVLDQERWEIQIRWHGIAVPPPPPLRVDLTVDSYQPLPVALPRPLTQERIAVIGAGSVGPRFKFFKKKEKEKREEGKEQQKIPHPPKQVPN